MRPVVRHGSARPTPASPQMRTTHQTHSNKERPKAGTAAAEKHAPAPGSGAPHRPADPEHPHFMPSPLTPHRHCTATITQPRDSEKSRAGQQRLPLAPRCCCSHAALKRSAATHAKSLPSGAGAPALLSARQQSAANPPQQPHQARFQCIPTPLPKANTAFRSWPSPLLPAGSTLPKTSTTAISAAYHGLTDASVQCRTLSAAQTTCEHAWGALPRIEQV